MKTASPYLEQLFQRVILFDGAMGTSIQAYPLTADDYGGEKQLGCIDYLSITKPRHHYGKFMILSWPSVVTPSKPTLSGPIDSRWKSLASGTKRYPSMKLRPRSRGNLQIELPEKAAIPAS